MIQADTRPIALCGQGHDPGTTCEWCERSAQEIRFAELVAGLQELTDAVQAAYARCEANPLFFQAEADQLKKAGEILEAAFLEIDLSVDCTAYFLIANELPVPADQEVTP